MKIVLIGIPGAGKSTQGNMLSHQLKIPYLSTGHIFREIAKEKTNLGHYVKEVLHSGMLIPDDKTIDIVNDYISRPEYKRGYILDGFPRTVKQAQHFKNNVDKVIYLEIPDKEALWRLAYRNNSGRDDSTIEAIKRRIEIFHTSTDPVIKHYEKEGKLIVIDGTLDAHEVDREILKSVGKQIVKHHVLAWKQKTKAIIAIVGLPGSGKTEAANFFKEKKLPIISFGKIVIDTVEHLYHEHKEEHYKEVREGLRKKHGNEVLAVLSEKKIREALKESHIVVIDGMRSWEEYTYLKEKFPDVKVYILALHTDKNIRYKRAAKRTERSKVGQFGELRDINELTGVNMGPTIAFADFLIKNNFSLHEFQDKLENVYRHVYFA